MKAKISWSPAKSVPANAAAYLPDVAARFFAAGDLAAKPGTPIPALHAFRIEAKRFRYTLEFFRPAYDAELDRLIQRIRRCQDILGEMNDCASTLEWLRESAPRPEQTAKLMAALEKMERRHAAEFRRYWRSGAGSERSAALWQDYLSRPNAEVKKAKATA